jgi:hypothetical protein
MPVFSGQLATTLYPDIDAQQIQNDIEQKASAPFWSGEEFEAAVARYEAQVVEEFGGESFESLVSTAKLLSCSRSRNSPARYTTGFTARLHNDI